MKRDLVVYDCEQNTEEWYLARLGKITSSEFQKLMVKNDARKGRATILRKLAGERITEQPGENYENDYMGRGKAMQQEGIDWYARTRFADVESCGFVYDPRVDAGWSPDGLVGEEGAVEIKTMAPHLLIPVLDGPRDVVPNEFLAQVQGGALWIGRRRWIDLVIYWPGMPKFVVRAEPDRKYHEHVAAEVEVFNRELVMLVARIKAMGDG